jgi:hypothetical protein
MGQYASFTLGEVAEAALNNHPCFQRRHGQVMVVVQGEPDNGFIAIKGARGEAVEQLPSLVLKGVVVDARMRPIGQVRLVATYDSLDVQQARTWTQWAQSKQATAAQIWAALRHTKGAAHPDNKDDGSAAAEFGPDFMGKLKDAVLDMPEFEFTLRECEFVPGDFDQRSQSWSQAGHEGATSSMDLSGDLAGQVHRAVDYIPGEAIIQAAMAHMQGGSDVREGLSDIHRLFLERRETAYARASDERQGEGWGGEGHNADPVGKAPWPETDKPGKKAQRRKFASHRGEQTSSGQPARGGARGGTVLDAEFTVRSTAADTNREQR